MCLGLDIHNYFGSQNNVTYMEGTRRLYVCEDQVLSSPLAIAAVLPNLVHQSIASYILGYGRDAERERERGGEREREREVT